ncbi:MAG TPA: LCP family protein [Verrucomicrobiae bacterium]|nr:LCP family protein [Verrucomicrobiae bacterium]
MASDPPRRRRAGLRASGGGSTRSRWGRRLTVAGFVLSGLCGVFFYFLPVLTTALHDTGQARPATDPGAAAAPAPGSGQPFTVLLLGSDNDKKFVAAHILTQTMILVRVVPATHAVWMLSLPRDLWVPISTGGSAKIDAAYELGGPASAIATVQQDFHVHVDYYAWVGLNGLVDLINRLGGIDLIAQMPVLDDFYPADLAGGDPYGYRRVAVLPGPQFDSGLLSLEYVRSRHGDLLGDIARSKRQQELLVDLRAAAHAVSLADLPSLISALNGQFHTDLGLGQVSALLPLARGITSADVHELVMLPPDFSYGVADGEDVLFPNWSAIQQLVARGFPSS